MVKKSVEEFINDLKENGVKEQHTEQLEKLLENYKKDKPQEYSKTERNFESYWDYFRDKKHTEQSLTIHIEKTIEIIEFSIEGELTTNILWNLFVLDKVIKLIQQ